MILSNMHQRTHCNIKNRKRYCELFKEISQSNLVIYIFLNSYQEKSFIWMQLKIPQIGPLSFQDTHKSRLMVFKKKSKINMGEYFNIVL